MQMCIQCNNKTKPTSTVGMLFPRYFVLGCNDYAFLLPGKVTMFLRWNYVLDYVIVFFYCTDRRITLQSNVSNDSLVRNVWSMQHATLRILHAHGRTLVLYCIRSMLSSKTPLTILIDIRSEIQEVGWKLVTASAILESWVLKYSLCCCFLPSQIYTRKISTLVQRTGPPRKPCKPC